jgi:hypothetical protein
MGMRAKCTAAAVLYIFESYASRRETTSLACAFRNSICLYESSTSPTAASRTAPHCSFRPQSISTFILKQLFPQYYLRTAAAYYSGEEGTIYQKCKRCRYCVYWCSPVIGPTSPTSVLKKVSLFLRRDAHPSRLPHSRSRLPSTCRRWYRPRHPHDGSFPISDARAPSSGTTSRLIPPSSLLLLTLLHFFLTKYASVATFFVAFRRSVSHPSQHQLSPPYIVTPCQTSADTSAALESLPVPHIARV